MLNSRFLGLAILLAFFLFQKNTIAQGSYPQGFAAAQVVTGLDPVSMALAPDGRVFIAEKYGRISIVQDGQLQAEPFLEVEVDIDSERGLCGVVFDPDFETNHYLYIYYTVKDEGHNRISRFKADGNFAIPGSETILMELDQLTGPFHNAGIMRFGNDGKLYIAVGDGTKSGNAQDLNTTLGKILRINPDGSIPSDNPFYNETTGNNRAIWTFGHRNPFGLSFDQNTGKLYSSEVGTDKFEEVNEIVKGKNYGWPLVEGPLSGQTPPADYQEPLHYYSHDEGCCAVGISAYSPEEEMFPPEYSGKLFFGEYCYDEIRMVDPNTGESEVFASGIDRPIGLLTADDGTMYMLDRATEDNFATSNGTLWRIYYTGSDAPFISVNPRSTLVPVGENAEFSVTVSGAAPLQFQWQLNGMDIPGATDEVLILENPMLSDSGSLVRCVVSNPFGSLSSEKAELRVTSSHRPTLELLQPVDGHQYRGGETLTLVGQAMDEEEGTLPAEAYRWRVDFHHDDHSHPAFGPVSGVTQAAFEIPQIGETSHNVWFRIHVSVTDASGLTTSLERDIFPFKSDIHLLSEPAGFPITIDGQRMPAPHSTTSVVGVLHEVVAAKSFIANDSLYLFRQWDSGETDPSIAVIPPDEGVTKTAIYEAVMHKGDGTGLTGQYYDQVTPNYEFVEPFAFERIDSNINFDWTGTSPYFEKLGNDYFLVRWEGAVMPFFDEVVNFHFQVEDGMRFWLNDELVINKWTLVFNELQVGIPLEGGKKYPIRIEYYQGNWLSFCKMLWSSEKLERDFVPPSRLFPEYVKDSTLIEILDVQVRPNPVSGLLSLTVESPRTQEIELQLFNVLGQLIIQQKSSILPGLSTLEMDAANLPTGEYFLKVEAEDFSKTLTVSKL